MQTLDEIQQAFLQKQARLEQLKIEAENMRLRLQALTEELRELLEQVKRNGE